MATLNVGAMAARLGLDPSEFMDKMKGVQGFNAFVSSEMQREWRKTGREGAESMRLIDEALGVHLSRPVTRILNQEFPALAKGLSGLLGAGVFGAIAGAGFEAFEKLNQRIERAQKLQLELRVAAEHAAKALAEVGDSWTLKIAQISAKKSFATIIAEGAEQARKQFQDLGKAFDEVEAKRAAASKFGTAAYAAVGNWWDDLMTSSAGRIAKASDDSFKELRTGLDSAFRADELHGTHSAMARLDADLASINGRLREYYSLGSGAFTSQAVFEAQTSSLERQKAFLEEIRVSVEKQREAWEKAKKQADDRAAAERASAEALERQRAAATALGSLFKDISSSLDKLQPQSDPIAKMSREITDMRMKAENDFIEMERNSASALSLRTARHALDDYERKLDSIFARFKVEQAITDAEAKLPGAAMGSGPMALSQATPQLPTLGAGGTAGAQVAAFEADSVAQLRLAAQAYQDALGPADRYRIVQQELVYLRDKKDPLIDQTVYNAALAKAYDEMVKAESGARHLEEQIAKLLERTDSATAGFQAFRLQLQLDSAGGLGRFTFDSLNEGLRGAEGNLSRMVALWEENARGARNLGLEFRKMWAEYFAGLQERTLKFAMDQALRLAAGKQSSDQGPAGTAGQGGVKGVLAEILGAGKGQSAGATLTTAGSRLIAAATALQAAAASLQSGGGGLFGIGGGGAGSGVSGGGDISSFGSAGDVVPFFAEGGNVTPGSSFISGEAGAEEVRLGADGGATVIPLGWKNGSNRGGDYFDMRGSVVTDELMRKADAVQLMGYSERRAAAQAVSMNNEVSKRSRP
ncbi:MAG TPA: hypothetical protein VMI10_01975 [Terriglobales bacterium]|nr:hypothetical protein [Terriglobales bacterium]